MDSCRASGVTRLRAARLKLSSNLSSRFLLGRATALKLGLDGFELHDYSLLRRNPPDDESFVADALPTEVSETQKCKGLGFFLVAANQGQRSCKLPGFIGGRVRSAARGCQIGR